MFNVHSIILPRSLDRPRCQSYSLLSFFFDWSYNMRHRLFHNLIWLPNHCVLDLQLLTSGNPTFSNERRKLFLARVWICKEVWQVSCCLVVHQKNSRTHHYHLSLSFLSSFSVLVQFTHINVGNMYIHACSIK